MIMLLSELFAIIIGGTMLINTWWCLFVSQYSPGLRVLWWLACLVISVWIMGAILVGEQNADKKDKK
jgi:hypothetical protein